MLVSQNGEKQKMAKTDSKKQAKRKTKGA